MPKKKKETGNLIHFLEINTSSTQFLLLLELCKEQTNKKNIKE